MNEDFIFRLGADVSSFTKSITEVEAELKNARAAVKTALGDDLIQANKYVEDLEQSLKNLKAIGVQVPGSNTAVKELGKLPPAAQKAQNTLTGLSGVVRDLPFGFVAIQNNLPILADSFGNLTKTSGGFKAGLKELGAALAGPAGVSFAIGAVISGITVLVQKYGSLSAAITEVLNLSKSQRDLNVALETATAKNIGSAEAEITVLKTLTGVLTNTQLSLDARNGAYDELNKKYPGLLTNLDKEKLKTGELNTQLAARIALFAKQIQLNGQRAALEKLIGEEAEKSFKTIAQFKNQSFLDGLTSELAGVLKGFSAGTAGLQDFSQSLSNGAKSTEFYNKRLNEIQTELSNVDGQILAIVEAGKKKDAQDKKDAQNVAEGIRKSKAKTEALKREREAILKRIEAERAARTERVPLQVSFDIAAIGKQDYGALYKKNVIDKFKKAQKETGGIEVPLNLPDVDPISRLQGVINKSDFFREGLAKDFENAKNTLIDVFFDPLGELFGNFFETGKFAFDEFGKSILKTIKSLVSRIIATGIINLLANILFPQGAIASAGLGGASTGAGGGILGAFGAAFKSVLGLGKVANPNFSGMQGGGMQLAGEVVFRQRGSDLIGVINRTNGTINRVG